MDYILKVTKSQAQEIQDALELKARLQSGQIKDVAKYLPCDDEYELERWLTHTYEQHRPDNTKNRDNLAWSIMTVIRHRLAWDDKPEGRRCDVRFDEPFWQSSEPMTEIEKIND